jgi:hypothetical protein
MFSTDSQESAHQGMAAYAGPSLFQPHHARKALRDAHNGTIAPLIGMYLGLSSIPTARFIAPFGFDVVWVSRDQLQLYEGRAKNKTGRLGAQLLQCRSPG